MERKLNDHSPGPEDGRGPPERISIWQRLVDVAALRRSPLSLLRPGISDPRDSVTFTIAVVALAAKLSKADGRVTRNEIAAFREVFRIEPKQEASVARVFNLFRRGTHGFESYARRVARLFGRDHAVLKDLLDGLFFISMADGHHHPCEHRYLKKVAIIFGVSEMCFRQLTARHVPEAWDPYKVIGVPRGAPPEEIRSKFRHEVREAHPDRLMARGMPKEMLELGTRRIVDLNRAISELRREKVPV